MLEREVLTLEVETRKERVLLESWRMEWKFGTCNVDIVIHKENQGSKSTVP